jgi:hypothetical protein
MIVRFFIVVVTVCFALILKPHLAGAIPTIFPKGTTIYYPTKAYNSYVLFGTLGDGKTYLIDMNGHEVHSWAREGFPAKMLDPVLARGKKGHILVQLDPPSGFHESNNRTVGEMDWDGDIVWSWGAQAPGGYARQSHDWDRLPNGNTLILSSINHVVAGMGTKRITDQIIREVKPNGTIVWSWTVGDHLDEFGFTRQGYKLLQQYAEELGVKNDPGFLEINDMQPIGPNRWFDAGDQRFAPDNIMIDSRVSSFIAIIDKKSGAVVWRLGPDYRPSAPRDSFFPLRTIVPGPIDQTSGQHDAHIIPKGLPGAGNLLVFDNEGPSGFPARPLPFFGGSRVLEINPVEKKVVWEYSAVDSHRPQWDFFSGFISSAQRLPNGNTLIDEGMNGRLFQVTHKGEIVWEYVNPHFIHFGSGLYNWVFRAQAAYYDWVPSGTPHTEVPVIP